MAPHWRSGTGSVARPRRDRHEAHPDGERRSERAPNDAAIRGRRSSALPRRLWRWRMCRAGADCRLPRRGTLQTVRNRRAPGQSSQSRHTTCRSNPPADVSRWACERIIRQNGSSRSGSRGPMECRPPTTLLSARNAPRAPDLSHSSREPSRPDQVAGDLASPSDILGRTLFDADHPANGVPFPRRSTLRIALLRLPRFRDEPTLVSRPPEASAKEIGGHRYSYSRQYHWSAPSPVGEPGPSCPLPKPASPSRP